MLSDNNSTEQMLRDLDSATALSESESLDNLVALKWVTQVEKNGEVQKCSPRIEFKIILFWNSRQIPCVL